MKAIRFAAIVVVAAALCACTKAGQSTVSDTTTLSIADGSGDITSLNPHLFTEIPLGFIAEMSQAYLVKYDAQNNPYPELLTVIPTQANGGISKDGDTITWHLRKGVRWSDGAPFNADDVVFSTQVVLNPKNNEVGRDGWNLITKIDEPDKYTVIYHLKKPYSPYVPTFFGSAGANPDILPKHLLAQYPNINNIAYNAKPVGIGPFRVVDWKRGDRVDLEANPYYFRGTPKLQHIVYKLIPSSDTLLTLLQTGDVELWPQLGATYIVQAKNIPNVTVDVHSGVFFPHFDFNVTRPIVSDVRVREAIRYAMNRAEIVQKVAHGYAKLQESMVPNTIPFAPKNIPLIPYDPAKARALLDQAGWKMGPGGIRVKNGQRLALSLPYSNGVATADSIMEVVRANLRDVGIEIDTRKWAPAMLFAPYQNGGIIYGGKWDMTFFSWQGLPIADISNLLECNQIPPNGQNVLHYCNAQVDKLLEEIKGTYDIKKQTQLLDQEQRIVIADVPTIVLYVGDIGYAHTPSLKGYDPGVFTPFDNMLNVSL